MGPELRQKKNHANGSGYEQKPQMREDRRTDQVDIRNDTADVKRYANFKAGIVLLLMGRL